jgi:transporter family protein
MQPWAYPAVLAAALITVHYLLLRAASGRLPDALGALLLEATAALGIAVYYLFSRRPDIPTSRAGVLFSMASGLAISGASVLIFAALRKGGPVASTGTIVLGGGVALSALLAPVFFAEGITARRAAGVALGAAAMVLLATER